MKDKKILAFEALLTKHQSWFKDRSLIRNISEGFKITGHEKYTGAFLEETNLPSMTEQTLSMTSAFNNEALAARTKSSGDPLVDNQIWEDALKETENNWLTGPFYFLGELNTAIPNRPALEDFLWFSRKRFDALTIYQKATSTIPTGAPINCG